MTLSPWQTLHRRSPLAIRNMLFFKMLFMFLIKCATFTAVSISQKTEDPQGSSLAAHGSWVMPEILVFKTFWKVQGGGQLMVKLLFGVITQGIIFVLNYLS